MKVASKLVLILLYFQKILHYYFKLAQSMSGYKDVTFSLKVVMNKDKTRVLFAEVDSGFVDLLFSFLSLPLGIVLQVFEKHYGDKTPHVIGSLNTLYNGLPKEGKSMFQTKRYKPETYKPEILNTEYPYAFPHAIVPVEFSKYHTSHSLGKAYFLVRTVFTIFNPSFIICDDLRVVPNVEGSIVQSLKDVGFDMADIDGSVTMNVTFGVNKVMDFLKGMLTSHQPLTDVILGTSAKPHLQRSESGVPLHQIKKEASSYSRNMVMKAMFQISTNKFLFAQVEPNFVDFLFAFLDTPLGLIDSHLGSNSSFNKAHNLYTSISELIGDSRTKDLLMEQGTSFLGYLPLILDGPRMYMVNDDLTLTPLFVTSVFSLLDQMKISPSDVEEVEFHIGSEEANNILRASLTSNCAISDGLIRPFLKKQKKPNQEH